MPIDPALCPIPPDFQVVGEISDDFEKYRDKSPYGHWYNLTYGYSQRWHNTKIRTANIVAGFQFKIGDSLSHRWKNMRFPWEPEWIPREHGDVNLLLPRAEPGSEDRGVYGVFIDWHKTDPSKPGVFKEIPHGDYSGGFGFNDKFNEDNPDPPIGNIYDAQWHGMLGAIWNDRDGTVTMSLWYNPLDTHVFRDFKFLGKAVDKSPDKSIPPRSPLTLGLDQVDEAPQGGAWGNELFRAEHDLSIRIDDVLPDELEVRNMFAVTVNLRHTVAPPPPRYPVPNVRELSPLEASQVVIAARFRPRFEGPNNSNSWVDSQSPNGGQMAEEGSFVIMTLRDEPRQ